MSHNCGTASPVQLLFLPLFRPISVTYLFFICFMHNLRLPSSWIHVVTLTISLTVHPSGQTDWYLMSLREAAWFLRPHLPIKLLLFCSSPRLRNQ